MQCIAVKTGQLRNYGIRIVLLGGVLMFFSGCGGTTISKNTSTSTSTKVSGPQTYFAPSVYGTNNIGNSSGTITTVAVNLPQTYSIDDTGASFSQTTYQLSPSTGQEGPQVLNAGNIAVSQRGLRTLGILANYYLGQGGTYVAQTYSSDQPKSGSFALELANQVAGLVQLVGQPAAPLVAATQCPNLSKAQTYQFISIPAPLISPSSAPQPYSWDPTTETAYGSVDISSSGSTVTFQNISQHTLPSVGGAGRPMQPATSSATGACGPTFFGQTTSVPGQLVVDAPGKPQSRVPPQATIGIGANGGLLVEDNGVTLNATLPNSSPALSYENVLGAGTGAVGLPKPSSPIDMSSLVGAQYLGFLYGAGVYNNGLIDTGWSSHLTSFGVASASSNCAWAKVNAGTTLCGGDFQNDSPSDPSNGRYNVAIDLGPQSDSGLFLQSTVWIDASYLGNTTGTRYSFPAVAIAGQIGGKYAIFALGIDSTQPWAIYLLQSN